MASHMFQRLLRSRSLLPALAAPAVLATASSARLEAAPEAEEAAAPARFSPAVEFVGVFVAKESAAKLRAQFPAKFPTGEDEQLFLVLRYQPSAQEQEAFAPILGRAARMQVKGLVEDDHTQAVVVNVTTESGDSLEYEGSAEAAHITLSSVEGLAGTNAGYSSVLLERLRASDKLQVLLENSEASEAWTGELPAFESKHLPLFNPFPASPAKVSKAEVELELEGTVCLSSQFDVTTGECAAPKAECGFCKFMKAGPCGKEFTAWEACLDRCKKSGDDFIDQCGPQTLALRDCVDANPEYYHVLQDGPEEDGDSSDKSDSNDKSDVKDEATPKQE